MEGLPARQDGIPEGKLHFRKRCPFCKGTVILVEQEGGPGPKLMHSKGACPTFGRVPDKKFLALVQRSRRERRAATSKKKGKPPRSAPKQRNKVRRRR